jgi:IS1 family transposase
MNLLSRAKQREIMAQLCNGGHIAGIAVVSDCSTTTIRRYIQRFGEALLDFHDRHMRGLKMTTSVEVDETWSYVGSKQPTRPGWGEYFTWTAIDSDSKAMISWKVGPRILEVGRELLSDLKERIEGRFLLSTDAYVGYPKIVDEILTGSADHVLIRKEIAPQWSRETGDRRAVLMDQWKEPRTFVSPELLSRATTSRVERMNATMRNGISRLCRQTYKFSKKLENHCHSQSIFFAYYNFCRPHSGFEKRDRKLTPAIKAGVTAKIWTFDDLLDEVDAYWAAKENSPETLQNAKRKLLALPPGTSSERAYFVMYSPKHRRSKVHAATCRNCRKGIGRLDGEGANQWFDFDTPDEAREYAKAIAPWDFSDCAMCMKHYYKSTRRRM